MPDAWTTYEERPNLGDVKLALFDFGIVSPDALDILVVENAMTAAFERPIDDGHDGVFVEGCRRSIETLRPMIDRRTLAKGSVGSTTDAEVAALAIELAEDMRARPSVRAYAATMLFNFRALVFTNTAFTKGFPQLTIYTREDSDEYRQCSAKSSQFEPVVQTINRAHAYITTINRWRELAHFVDLHLRVMACKRLGSELLDWRY